MGKKYMIVRIIKIHYISEIKKTENGTLWERDVSKPCFEIFENDFETPESAVDKKNKYMNPSQFIVVPYYV
jgi:hypothetical protein